MKPKLTHVALLVSNVDITVDFYIKYCGFKVIERRMDPNTGCRVVWLGEKLDFVIVAFETEKKPIQSLSKPLSHLGFSLDSRDAVDQISEVARQEGILEYGPIYFDETVGYICNILDPDGNCIEFSYGQKLG